MRRLVLLLAPTLLCACLLTDVEPVGADRVATHVDDWRDEVIYQLLTDRFANGDPRNDFRVRPDAMAAYHGGDWQGVIDRLGYLEALGVTALWISPIVRNVDQDAGVDGYHGYWAQDFTRLNPHFGDLATLRRLVDEAHARGMKVILDIVTNHVGQVFFYDINMNGQPDDALYGSGTRSPLTRVTEYDPDYDPRGIQSFTSLGESGLAPVVFIDLPELFRIAPSPAIFGSPDAYNRRGRVTDWNDRQQVIYGDFPGGLKDLATERPEVREALIRVYVDWALKLDLDGFRIDTIKHVEDGFWQVFAPEVRRRLAQAGKRRFFLFGEAFDGNDDLLASYTRPGMFDSVFYFSQKFRVYDDVFMRGGPTSRIEQLWRAREERFGAVPQEEGIGIAPRHALVNFIDNHDVPRFLYNRPDLKGPGALRAAVAYLLTQDGIPCLYYGTEQEFSGGNDPANREDLWKTGYRTDGETFRWTARLIKVRRAYEALRRGDFRLRWTTERTSDAQDAGIVAFERTTPEGGYALVVVNSNGEQTSETSASAFGGGSMLIGRSAGDVLVDALSNDRWVVGQGGSLAVQVPPHSARVLVPAEDLRPLP